MKLRTVNMKQYNERKYLIVDERGLPIPRLCEFTLTHLYGASEIPSFLETQMIPSVRVYKRCCFR